MKQDLSAKDPLELGEDLIQRRVAVMLYRHDGRMRVYRSRNEKKARQCVREVDRHGGGSVMMWAGISVNDRTELLHVQGNLLQ